MYSSVAVLGATLVCFGILTLAPFTRRPLWRATVTPLASIIGSGFLVSAPLLSREFGGYAAPAMVLLIALAMGVGWAIRYNIGVVEPQLGKEGDRRLRAIEKVSDITLAFAYFVSVAYYLSLLGHFVLESMRIRDEAQASAIAIALLLIIGLLGWTGGVRKVAGVERYATAFNLSVIAGLLVGLTLYAAGLIVHGEPIDPPPGIAELSSIPVLLGLLIVVQGFETTRFMGDEYDPLTRQRAMRTAQIASGCIYVMFFILLSPLLHELSTGTGVAEIITVSVSVAAILPLTITLGAMASQFSASIADSVGNAGLVEQITGGRIDPRHAYILITLIGVAIIIVVNVNEVIALASRAFALFYALQCVVAWEAARKRPGDLGKARLFLVLAFICAGVCIIGVPAG